jgi:hypothetical protein
MVRTNEGKCAKGKGNAKMRAAVFPQFPAKVYGLTAASADAARHFLP